MSVVASPMIKEDDNAWASRYLLDPLNPVEAWQTAQVGGQYNNTIPSQHSLKSHSPISSFVNRSKIQDVLKSIGQESTKKQATQENIKPISTNPYQQPRVRLSRHQTDEATERRERRRIEASKRNGSKKDSSSSSPRRPRPMKGVPADLIDSLDTSFGGAYHHEGPFDATLAARNRHPWKSPVEATKIGNQLALEATAPADIENSLENKQPLDGVAAFPSGTVFPGGKQVKYEEYDIQRKEGDYRRYSFYTYLDEDLKGKGIVGYEGDKLEKSLKASQQHRRGKSEHTNSFEMQTRGSLDSANTSVYHTADLRRANSTAGRFEGAAAKIRRRFSLNRRSKGSPEMQ